MIEVVGWTHPSSTPRFYIKTARQVGVAISAPFCRNFIKHGRLLNSTPARPPIFLVWGR